MNEPLNVRRRVKDEQVRARARVRRVRVAAPPCRRRAAARAAPHRQPAPTVPPCRRAVLVRCCCLQIITDRLISIKEQSHAMRACEWFNSRQHTDVMNQQLSETKRIAQELDQENRVTLLLRKARMKDFLEEEARMFEGQLNAIGKAFCKER